MLLDASYSSSVWNRDPFSRKSLVSEATSDFKLLRGITTQTGMSTAMPNFGAGGIRSFHH